MVPVKVLPPDVAVKLIEFAFASVVARRAAAIVVAKSVLFILISTRFFCFTLYLPAATRSSLRYSQSRAKYKPVWRIMS